MSFYQWYLYKASWYMRIQEFGDLYSIIFGTSHYRSVSYDTLWANYIFSWHFLTGNRNSIPPPTPVMKSMEYDTWELSGHVEGGLVISSDGEWGPHRLWIALCVQSCTLALLVAISRMDFLGQTSPLTCLLNDLLASSTFAPRSSLLNKSPGMIYF